MIGQTVGHYRLSSAPGRGRWGEVWTLRTPAHPRVGSVIAGTNTNVREPAKTKNVSPVYPEGARIGRVQGVVILECVISPEGKVVDVKVLRGIKLLNAAAIDAVWKWEYTPTLLDGVPVPVIMTVTVNFKLNP